MSSGAKRGREPNAIRRGIGARLEMTPALDRRALFEGLQSVYAMSCDWEG